tara:strand:- start:272 stop:448 length:177 start_codon:yes stop_codon:yes gene_type:complete
VKGIQVRADGFDGLEGLGGGSSCFEDGVFGRYGRARGAVGRLRCHVHQVKGLKVIKLT